MKKLMGLLLTFAMVLTCLSTQVVSAATNLEEENNNTANSANLITSTVTGNLSASSDVDYYKFNATKDYFVIDFSLNTNSHKEDVGDGWNIYIYDKDNDCIASSTNLRSYTSPRLAFSGMIYIKITKGGYYVPAGVDYDIKITQATNALWESEYNGTATKANEISTEKIYVGSLFEYNDTDYYKTTITKDYFVVYLDLDKNFVGYDVGNGWDIEIYDKDHTLLDSCTDIKQGYVSQNHAISGTVYVKITRSGYYCPTNIEYNLKIVQNADPLWESEYNGTTTTANKISTGKTYTGSLFKYDDIDYYKTNITGDYFVVEFGSDKDFYGYDVGNGWKISIYDKNNKCIASCSSIKNSYTSQRLAISGTIYIKIERSGYYCPAYIHYNLKVTQKTDSKWENEYNGTLKTATNIKKDVKYGGSLYSYDDVDYYKLKVPAEGTVGVKFSRDLTEDDGNGYKIEVKNKHGQIIKEISVNDISKGSMSSIKVSKGTYYIVVKRNGYYAPSAYTNYKISYSFKLAKPTLKSVEAKKNTIKVNWEKKKYVDGYEIQYSTNKKFNKAKVVKVSKCSTVSKTLKKLSTNKKYYVRIRTFKNVDNKKIYSSWTKAKYVKTKK